MELEEQCREEEKQHWARVAALIQVHFTLLPVSHVLRPSCITRVVTDILFGKGALAKEFILLVFRGTRRQLPPTKALMKG